MSPITNAGVYVIQTLFSLYLLIVVFRFLLQLVRADFYNPLSQFVVRATNPFLNLLRKIIPGHYRFDLPSLLLALMVQMLELVIVVYLRFDLVLSVPHLFLWSIAGLLALVFNIYFFLLIIDIIASWVAPQSYHPALMLVRQLIAPIMDPVRKLLPPAGGLDFSPLLVFMLLNVLNILLIAPLAQSLGIPRGLLLGL